MLTENVVTKKMLYRVIFSHQGKVYDVYARSISQSQLLGFIEVEQFVFGENSAVVVDPSEEKIKAEFYSVKRTYVPMHAIYRIDEVLREEGVSKIRELDPTVNASVHTNVVSPFPQAVFTKPKQPTDNS